MLVYQNGYFETGDWQTEDTYPDKEYYIIDESTEEGATLAAKVISMQPCTLIIVDGDLVDVVSREKTTEEIAAEQPANTPEQLRIEQLEQIVADLAALQLEV